MAKRVDENRILYYTNYVIEVRQTSEFSSWFDRLRDERAKARILVRIRRISLGNAGDAKPTGQGVSELRIDYGPEYRVYFTTANKVVVILLCGGDKRTQDSDIKRAKEMAKELKGRSR